MRVLIIFLGFGLLLADAASNKERSAIVGGSVAVFSQYPSIASLLYSPSATNYKQACVGSVLTTRSILTAAHCVYADAAYKWRVRVGSNWANSGGSVYTLGTITSYPNFSLRSLDNDIAILRTNGLIAFNNVIRPASIAGSNYQLADNQVVWSVGWGRASVGSSPSEQLRHVQMWIINQSNCAARYAAVGNNVTGNMLCSGWPYGVSGYCQGDEGGPLYHNGVLVGLSSWGYGCVNSMYPGVNTRISRYTSWIQTNA
ncbi:trypsin, alkaline B-like [Trichoplusia ni]|uniref:Trypsin, alkaline B-like n=1 Tax=Trichoplusia ni TaxID=7111 RepID=A0A7E5WFA1_TRINI|nr:trypsin, alkaline B-like [Trichoplusia ni]